MTYRQEDEEKKPAAIGAEKPENQGTKEPKTEDKKMPEEKASGSTQANTAPPRAQQGTTNNNTSTQEESNGPTHNRRSWITTDQVDWIEMSEERVVEILRTFRRSRTKVNIIDITRTTITDDCPGNPHAVYRMLILASVARLSTELPQSAVHTPHTHLTVEWCRIDKDQIQITEALLRRIRNTMPLTLAAELYMKEEEPKLTRSPRRDYWCLPLHIHRN